MCAGWRAFFALWLLDRPGPGAGGSGRGFGKALLDLIVRILSRFSDVRLM
jgi:hypothetical protein